MKKSSIRFNIFMAAALSAMTISGLAACSPAKPDQSQTEPEKQALSIIQLDPEADEILVNEETDITVKTDPSDYALSDSNFNVDGGSITYSDGHAKFKADKAGTYTISAEADNIKSNPVTIKVVDEKAEDSKTPAQTTDKADNSKPAQSENQTSKPEENQNTSSSSQQTPSAPAASGQTLGVADVLADPGKYVDQAITINGFLPQAAMTGADGKPAMFILSSADGSGQKLQLSDGSKINFGGCQASLSGTLKKLSDGTYVFDVADAVQLDSGAAANPNGRPDSSVSTMPKSGTFHFTVNDVIIRNGTDGLSSPASGYVYNAGMSVRYDGLYQKDGYTWITYTAHSGTRHSVAIGNTTEVLYGFLE